MSRFPREIPPGCTPLRMPDGFFVRETQLFALMEFIWGFRCNRRTPTPIGFEVLERFR